MFLQVVYVYAYTMHKSYRFTVTISERLQPLYPTRTVPHLLPDVFVRHLPSYFASPAVALGAGLSPLLSRPPVPTPSLPLLPRGMPLAARRPSAELGLCCARPDGSSAPPPHRRLSDDSPPSSENAAPFPAGHPLPQCGRYERMSWRLGAGSGRRARRAEPETSSVQWALTLTHGRAVGQRERRANQGGNW